MPPRLRILSPCDVHPRRGRPVDAPTIAQARDLLDRIESEGVAAVLDLAERFGDIAPGQPLTFDPDALKTARDRLPPDQRAVLERTGQRIRAFAEAQRACIRPLSFPIEDGTAGHDLVPVSAAGCYAPGGRFPLPSSVLMTAVTARTAEVQRVWVASPRPTDATLAAASIAGADGVLAIGGVQAIAALAFGLGGVPACDTIVGPGNRWVTAAKFLVSDRVGIDMLAGPSELVVLADGAADPAMIAADLLAQAEHDTDAVPILICTSTAVIEAVQSELERQLESLATRAIAAGGLANGYAVLAGSLREAIELTDRIGPEHLEIMVRDADAAAAQIRNAGGIFIGPQSAEVLGDYGAGPNHVLPTGGTSRFRAGLSVLTFLRARTWLRVNDAAGANVSTADAAALARIEGLEGHARSAEHRANCASGHAP